MRRGSIALILVGGVFFVAGCTQNSPRAKSLSRAAPAVSSTSETTAASPGKSLAKVREGMSFEQVVTILGPPTEQRSQLTAHAFNPFAVGNQGQVTRFYYEKMGRVVFAGPDYGGGGTAVIAVEEDPHESGHPLD